MGQNIREAGPQAHQVKAGTPTMGGLLILFAVIVPTLLWANLTNAYVWLVVLVTAGLRRHRLRRRLPQGARKRNLGLTARSKFLLQMAVGRGGRGPALRCRQLAFAPTLTSRSSRSWS